MIFEVQIDTRTEEVIDVRTTLDLEKRPWGSGDGKEPLQILRCAGKEKERLTLCSRDDTLRNHYERCLSIAKARGGDGRAKSKATVRAEADPGVIGG